MEFEALLEARRSIRAFDGSRKVSAEQIEQMVQAAIQAPSWKNTQTSRYYAVLSEEKLEAMRKGCLPEFNIRSSQGAALVVTTFVANRVGFDKETGLPVNECGNGWGYYDLGLHNANFVLKAKELGLDTLIMGIRDAEAIRAMLAIPEEETIVSVIAVGYAAQPAQKPARKTVQQILKVL